NPMTRQLSLKSTSLGLQGTCSIDYAVQDLLVPDGEWIYFPVQKPAIDDTLYHFSFFGALASGVASVALGLAQRARDEFRLLAQKKKPSGSRSTLSQKTMAQVQLAQTEAAYLGAKLLLENSVRQAWEEAEARQLSKESKAQLRLAATHAVQASVALVDAIYNLAGGSSIWDGVKIQEIFRDIHVLTQHALVSPQLYETYGRVALGQEVNEWTL
ncbi:MAG: acyl-CoA dehydrogenase family protein, partial [Bacteroidota bacterium]